MTDDNGKLQYQNSEDSFCLEDLDMEGEDIKKTWLGNLVDKHFEGLINVEWGKTMRSPVRFKFCTEGNDTHKATSFSDAWIHALSAARPESINKMKDLQQFKFTLDGSEGQVTVNVYSSTGTIMFQGHHVDWLSAKLDMLLLAVKERLTLTEGISETCLKEINDTTTEQQTESSTQPSSVNSDSPIPALSLHHLTNIISDHTTQSKSTGNSVSSHKTVANMKKTKQLQNSTPKKSNKENTPSKIPKRQQVTKTNTPSSVKSGSNYNINTQDLATTLSGMFKTVQQIDHKYCELMRNGHNITDIANKLRSFESNLNQQNTHIQQLLKMTEKHHQMYTEIKQTQSSQKASECVDCRDDIKQLDKKINHLNKSIQGLQEMMQQSQTKVDTILQNQQQQQRHFQDTIVEMQKMNDSLLTAQNETEARMKVLIKEKEEKPQHNKGKYQELSTNPFAPLMNAESVHGNPFAREDESSEEQQWKTPRVKFVRKTQTLIVGDSMLKDINPSRVYRNTHVRTLRGSNIPQITSYIQSVSASNINNIVIHAGTNDIDSGIPVEECVNKYSELVQSSKFRIQNGKSIATKMPGCKVLTEVTSRS
ncbi:uncharacterized protein MCAP_0864-like [Ptychodera flava]|uniref:uncharacterized protein MCAP_0864-like n=1 Tax=Ptychodera flava TaxID=63121 RepID=UPI003969F080